MSLSVKELAQRRSKELGVTTPTHWDDFVEQFHPRLVKAFKYATHTDVKYGRVMFNVLYEGGSEKVVCELYEFLKDHCVKYFGVKIHAQFYCKGLKSGILPQYIFEITAYFPEGN